MATRSQRIKVGAFLVLNAIIFVVALATVAGMRTRNEVEYTVIFEGSILGLSKGSVVHYEGVEVGRVEEVFVGRDQRANVKVLVDVDIVTLYEGVEAVLEIYSLATGAMSVALSGGDPELGPHDPDVPIHARPSLVESFSNQFGMVLEEVGEILDGINKGLEGLPEGELVRLITETTKTIEEVQQVTRQIGAIVEDTAELREGLLSGMQSVEEGVGEFRELAREATELTRSARDTVEVVREKIEPIDLDETTRRLTARVDSLGEQLESVLEGVEGTSEALVFQVDNVQYSTQETARILNETLEAVRDLAEFIRDNPGALVRGR